MRSPHGTPRRALAISALLLTALVTAGCGDADDTGVDPPPIPPEPTRSEAVPTAPPAPDLDGDLLCRVELQLAEDERAELEVRFDPPDDCLVRID